MGVMDIHFEDGKMDTVSIIRRRYTLQNSKFISHHAVKQNILKLGVLFFKKKAPSILKLQTRC